jgi:ABC-type glycerol-3-phosphate transport system substrate-binding protein
VVAGNGGWVSGSRDERKQEAVAAFMKFLTSREESIEQTRQTGAYPAVEIELSDDEAKDLEPLAASLVKESTSVPLTYPHVYFSAPGAFATAWKNTWPAYVQGKLDTAEFLTRLGEDATSPAG